MPTFKFEAMGKHPKCFDRLYVNMVRAGEAGGALEVILQRLADFKEKAQTLKRKIIGAMVYPAVVITFACLVLTFMLLFIIPVFVKVFDQLHGNLPTPTAPAGACAAGPGAPARPGRRRPSCTGPPRTPSPAR